MRTTRGWYAGMVAGVAAVLAEGGQEARPKVFKLQLRPDPLAR